MQCLIEMESLDLDYRLFSVILLINSSYAVSPFGVMECWNNGKNSQSYHSIFPTSLSRMLQNSFISSPTKIEVSKLSKKNFLPPVGIISPF